MSPAVVSRPLRRVRIPPLAPVAPCDGYSVRRDRVVWMLAGVALLVQLLYLWVGDIPTGAGDQLDYRTAAHDFGAWWAVANTSIQRMPGYPLLLSIAYGAGLGDFGIQLVQAILLSLCVVAVAYMASLVGGRGAARVGGGLFAAYLPLLSFSTVLLTEATTIALGLSLDPRDVRIGAPCGWRRREIRLVCPVSGKPRARTSGN